MTTLTMLPLQVNGQPRSVAAGTSVRALLESIGVDPELVAVEINRDLVRRAEHGTRLLAAGDKVEIVEFVGGG